MNDNRTSTHPTTIAYVSTVATATTNTLYCMGTTAYDKGITNNDMIAISKAK